MSTIPAPRKGKMLSFPPLVKKWTVKGEPNWPGAEYTRRTRLKTNLDPTHPFSAEFVDEMRELLGENYDHYASALQPAVNRKHTRGKPASESGHRPIAPPYVLPRANRDPNAAERDLDAPDPLAGTTLSLSGHLSKTRQSDNMYTKFGPVPEYMFEDREGMANMDEWFEKYGRPKDSAINLGSKQLFTHFEKSSKRCCGEPSEVQVMKKGFITA